MKQLKKILLNNISIKLLAVVIAFFTWFAVMYTINPIQTKTLTVPVHIVNDSTLTGKNWVYDVVGDGLTKVTVKAKSFDMAKISEADFYLSVDMRYLSGSTNNEKRGAISAEIVANNDLIEAYEVEDSYLEFKLEEIVSREYKINIITTGEAAENFVATNEPTAVPDTVTVAGRSSEVEKVGSVVYYLDIKNASEEINEFGKPILLSTSGNEIENTENLSVSPSEVQICLPIMQTKTVKVNCDGTSGIPATGYAVSSVELDLSQIKIAGYKAILSNVTAITIPASEINVEGLAQTKTFSIDLNNLELPNGVSINSTNSVVGVTVHVEKLKQNIYRLTVPDDISITGKSELYDYSFGDTLVNITVEGTSANLASMEAANIQASLDVSNLVDGTYTLMLNISLPEDISLAKPAAVSVTVTSKVIIVPTEPTQPTTEETTTEEETTEEETIEEPTQEETAETESESVEESTSIDENSGEEATSPEETVEERVAAS